MLLLFFAELTDMPVVLPCAISSRADYVHNTLHGSNLSLEEGQARLNLALP